MEDTSTALLLRQQRLRGIFDRVLREIDRAEKLHPDWPVDLLRQCVVVSEEAGESLQAGLNLVERIEYNGKHPHARLDVTALQTALDEEMIQTAAMAIRFLYNRSVSDRT